MVRLHTDGWMKGNLADNTAIAGFLAVVPHLYRSPAAPESDEALYQGLNRLYWQDNELRCAILAGKPGTRVVDLVVCACIDMNTQLLEGLLSLEQEAQAAGTRWMMAIAPPTWLLRYLLDTYQFVDTVIFYGWHQHSLEPAPGLPNGVTVGEIKPADIEAVLRVDEASFVPIWQASRGELNDWLSGSQYAVTLTIDRQVVAYLLAGVHRHSGHIYRLAVDPAWQRNGLGKWLMLSTMHQMLAGRVRDITLNTQASNDRSRKLYERLGFTLTGQEATIYAHALRADL